MEQLPVAFAGLATYRQFIIWKSVPQNDGTVKKLPVDHRTLQVMQKGQEWQSDPAAWTDAQSAIAIAKTGGSSYGAGFFFTKDDPFFFVDIDKCLHDGQWSETAVALCQAFAGCAVEVSQSGRGLHIFGTATHIPHGCKNIPLGLELYTEGRFVALTGDGATGDANTCPAGAFERTVATYFPAPAHVADVDWTAEPVAEWSGPADDEALIAKMLKSKTSAAAALGGKATVQQLWAADEDALATAYPDEQGLRAFDNSSADAALCQHLAFWTGKDCERMDRLFRLSGLYRDKWEEREDYRQRTILHATGHCSTVYGTKKQNDNPVQEYEPVKPQPVIYTGSTPEMRAGFQYLAISQQAELFAGCVYVRDLHRVFTPDGGHLKPEQFKAMYGGYVFALDSMNDKTTKNAWEAFTESQAARFPRAHGTCFRPECVPGELIEEEGRVLVNTYIPIITKKTPGDVSPFLNHLAKMLPDENDRAILMAYMAACVQHLGVKFQWTPLLQGCEGNGKTLFINCISATVGHRYTHLPNASDLGGNGAKFTMWLQNKVFIGVEEIYVSDRREVSDALKPLITNSRVEIQGKGADQVMGDNRANFFMCSNHKDAILKTRGDRRYCVFFTAQQEVEDLTRDGMRGDYFPKLYGWLRSGGYAMVANYLSTYKIPASLNPAELCQRAPATSSTNEAIAVSMGGIEQEILEAVDEGRAGFAGGWVSSMAFDRLLHDRRDNKRIPPNKRKELLGGLGYVLHPGLKDGRVNSVVLQENGKPRLYIKSEHPSASLETPPGVLAAYIKAQGYAPGGVAIVDEAIK